MREQVQQKAGGTYSYETDGVGNDLFDFRHVPVAAYSVAVDAFSDLSVQQVLLGAPASTADTRLGVYDDVVLLNEARLWPPATIPLLR